MGVVKRHVGPKYPPDARKRQQEEAMPLEDRADTELQRKEHENQTVTTLYDPPVGGVTPVDGEGNPRSSVIAVRDVGAKLKQGFTLAPEPTSAVAAATPEEGEIEEDEGYPRPARRAKK